MSINKYLSKSLFNVARILFIFFIECLCLVAILQSNIYFDENVYTVISDEGEKITTMVTLMGNSLVKWKMFCILNANDVIIHGHICFTTAQLLAAKQPKTNPRFIFI